LDFWYDSIRKASSEDIVIYLVGKNFCLLIGNKSDLVQLNENFRRVSKERAKDFANKYNIQNYDECSAKDNTNIHEIFNKLYKGRN
jgi:hypothetical protein